MSEMRTAGADIQRIQNRICKKIITDKGEIIVLTLEKCHIPFFAKYNESEISVIYNADFEENVNEIIRKVMSGVFDEIVVELNRVTDTSIYKSLLPEIAEILSTSVSFLKSRPDEVQEILCKRYVDLWYCDTSTIKRELEEIVNLGNTKEHYVSADVFRKRIENTNQIHRETREHYERERRLK